MVFYKDINDLSEKIIKISKDEKLRKKIARRGKIKYTKYFNSNNVAQYIINKSFDLKLKINIYGKNKKNALITGITGQDGSYLAEFLLKKITKFMV